MGILEYQHAIIRAEIPRDK